MAGYAKLCEKYYGVPKIVEEMAHMLEKKDKKIKKLKNKNKKLTDKLEKSLQMCNKLKERLTDAEFIRDIESLDEDSLDEDSIDEDSLDEENFIIRLLPLDSSKSRSPKKKRDAHHGLNGCSLRVKTYYPSGKVEKMKKENWTKEGNEAFEQIYS